jgi:hypothetical protein
MSNLRTYCIIATAVMLIHNDVIVPTYCDSLVK